jgi:hypothetical protein
VLACCGGVEDAGGVEALQFAAAVLGAIRKKKSEEQRPLKTPVALTIVRAPATLLALLPAVEADLRASGLIQELHTAEGETLQVDVTLAPAEGAA